MECHRSRQVEDDRIPGCRRYLLGIPADDLTSEVRAGVARWFEHGRLNFDVREETSKFATSEKKLSEPLVRTYVGVLQVDQLQSGGIPIKLFTLSVRRGGIGAAPW